MRLKLSALLILLCGAMGCQSQSADVFSSRLPTVGPPSEQGFTMDFEFHVANVGSGTLAVDKVQYKLLVAGVEVLREKYPVALRIGNSGPINVLAHVTWEKLVAATEAIARSSGEVEVALDGTAGDAPLRSRCTIPLRQMLQSPDVAANSDARRLAAALGIKLTPPATKPTTATQPGT